MYTLIYLDDVIVYSKTEEEHLMHLRAMLEQFMEHGLKLKACPNVTFSALKSVTSVIRYLRPGWNRVLTA